MEVLKTIWGPRIAGFLDADAEAEQPWLATEYIDGPDLRKHVHTHGPLPVVLTASLGATLAEALAGVHKQGLLHRDLKPANILLGPNGPKIIDFGLAVFTESSASLTAPNTVLGTPACMALAADEMEAWLMLFPEAFTKLNSAWKLTQQDRRRNLGTIPGGSKELLKSRLTQPRYLESHAPKVIEKAVTHGYVTSCDPSRNRSYADFTADLAQWK
ncbi:protein kinase [Streptomyces sp. NPDC005402]|uniref:protein kinase domain-containing protein n=1 Tax=Streptomyces sp. NPDC005402 TaxID=3155338 RepID=UPI0033B8E45A